MDWHKALKKVSYFFSNRISQKILGINISVSQYLRGVGAGAGVLSSGEEKVVDKLIGSMSRDSICIFDVGANRGDFISLVRRRVTGKYKIHAFEPLTSTFDVLNEKYGSTEGVKVNNFALGRSVGEEEIYYDEEESGLTSMTKRDIGHIDKKMDKSENVKISTIDSYCTENNVDRIDLLKVDVEGHELDVFEGARKVIDKGVVSYIMFEFGGCNIDTRTYMKDYFNFFDSMGFKRISRITPSGYLFALGNYSERVEQFMTTNYLVEM